jgi:hypothetical protein
MSDGSRAVESSEVIFSLKVSSIIGYVAINRFTGDVIDKQIEVVNE